MIYYITQSRIASPSANSIHVVNMFHSLDRYYFDKVRLFYIRGESTNVRDFYGIDLKLDKGYVRTSHLLINLLAKLLWDKPRLIYSRSIYGSLLCNMLGFSVLHEHHTVKRGIEGCAQRLLLLFKYNRHAFITHELAKDLRCNDYLHLPDASRKFNTCERAQKNTIGYIGSDKPGKGMGIVAAVSELVIDKLFIIAGNTTPRIDRLNLTYFGLLKPAVIPDILGRCEVVILPNYGSSNQDINKYTSPLKLFEYMAAKKIIVLSDLSVFREILSEEDAYFFEPGNVSSLKEAIFSVYADFDRAEIKAERAYQKFLKYYTWDIRAKKLLDYEGI